MSYKDFESSIRKVTGKKYYRITNSIGVKDAYLYIRKNKWFDIGTPLKESQFYSIIRTMNNHIADAISSGEEVTLPMRMGSIELRKYETYVKLENGKLKTNRAIDWNKTLKLWYEDEESYSSKTLVRVENNTAFKLYYNKKNANYNNQRYYKFSFHRSLKNKLKYNINKGNIDAFNYVR